MINEYLKEQSKSVKLIDCIQYYFECMRDNQKTWGEEWLEIINYKLSSHPNKPTLFEFLNNLKNNRYWIDKKKEIEGYIKELHTIENPRL